MSLTKKEWGIVGITVFFLFIIVNVVSYLVIQSKFGFSIYDTESSQKEKIRFKKVVNKGSIPHPFFGLSRQGWESFENPLTSEPFFHHVSEIKTKDPIKVLVLGGSVAKQMTSVSPRFTKEGIGYDDDLLASLLNAHFKTEKFVVYSAAFGGGKQPQQYFKYQYLDLIGFRPHIVINLDGFNEIALPISENKLLGNPAIFPRSYSKLLHATTSDRFCAELSNKLLNLDTKIPIAELIIWIYVRNCHSKIEQRGLKTVPWWSSAMGVKESQDYLAESIAIWERSSNKLNEALTARGVDYIHVLQSNQYLEGSKKLSKEEKQKYLSNENYGKPMRENYKKLSGRNLTTINFRDQRFLFRNIDETVYIDSCCHFNRFGMEIIIKDIISSNESIFKKHLMREKGTDKLTNLKA